MEVEEVKEKVEVKEEYRYSKITYILCALFLGGLGVHSFIARKPIQGILFIITSIIGFILSFLIVGFFVFLIEGIVLIVQIILAAGKKADKYGNIK